MTICLQAAFLGVGSSELALVLLVALILLGPRELPKIARTIGKVMAQLRSVSDDFHGQIMRMGDEVAESPQPDQLAVGDPMLSLPETTTPVDEHVPVVDETAVTEPPAVEGEGVNKDANHDMAG